MTDQRRPTRPLRPAPPASTVQQSRPRQTPTERRAAHFAALADQQAQLKREAAERRLARAKKTLEANGGD